MGTLTELRADGRRFTELFTGMITQMRALRVILP